MKYFLLFSIVIFSSVSSAQSGSLLPADLNECRLSGFQHLYNMDYVHAKEQFIKMTRLAPQHPAGYIYLAGAIWLDHLASMRRLQTQLYNRNDSFFTSNSKELLDPSLDKNFQTLIAKGIALAEERRKNNKADLTALYYLGVANGALAAYEATVKRAFFPSLKHGSRAVDFHRQVVKNDPRFIDAYLSIGMYDYVVGSLPLAVKILAFIGGVHGSKSEGLKKLETVYKEGDYTKDEAGAILILLYDREKRTVDSLRILQQLSFKYPQNFIFRMELGRAFAREKKFPESFVVFEKLLSDSAAMNYMPDFIHYQYARALFDSRQFENAREHFLAASFSPKAPMSLISSASLEAGKCLDASGKRKMAEAEYRYVLKLPNAFHSHDEAEKYLKNPYVPE